MHVFFLNNILMFVFLYILPGELSLNQNVHLLQYFLYKLTIMGFTHS